MACAASYVRLGRLRTTFSRAALAAAGGRLRLITQGRSHDMLFGDFGQLEVGLLSLPQASRKGGLTASCSPNARASGDVGAIGGNFVVLDPLHAGDNNEIKDWAFFMLRDLVLGFLDKSPHRFADFAAKADLASFP